MSQTKVDKIQIRNLKDADGKLSAGANMEVLLNGTPLKGVSFFKFEVKSKGIAKVMLEMYADVDIDANVILSNKSLEQTDLQVGGKPVALYQIGNYQPKAIAIKSEPCGPSYCAGCSCGKREEYDKP